MNILRNMILRILAINRNHLLRTSQNDEDAITNMPMN